MNHGLTRKLILYFTTLLILFALVVSAIFLVMYSRQATEFYKTDLQNRALKIADTISGLLREDAPMGSGRSGPGQAGGYGAYLRFLDDIAMTDVWLVDQNARTISVGVGKHEVRYSDLPQEGVHLLDRIFSGEASSSEGFSTLLGDPSVTAGAPVRNTSGQVVAAVLLHSRLENVRGNVQPGILLLLLSLFAALLVTLLISILMARRFIKPLQQMAETTQRIADGDYSARTNVQQGDEIGSLAQNIDTLSERLADASEESQRLEQMRRDFITNISHELRTPVTVMRGSLEALCDGVVSEPEQVAEYHQQMLSESVHLERMVNDLLALSRLQNPDYKIEKTPLNLADVLNDAVRAIRPIAQRKPVKIEYIPAAAPFSFTGDYGRLRQLFLILLDNAVKFSSTGDSVVVSMTSGAELDDGCAVTIADHGCGISEDELPLIFDRFYKTSGPGNGKGTGLGLAIAKEIADRHGIAIQVRSQPGAGTAFRLSFPAANKNPTRR